MMGGAMCQPLPRLSCFWEKTKAVVQQGEATQGRGCTHTPDLEEGSSLLQATQQMGRRIPNKGEGAHTLQTLKKAHLCFRPHSKWAEGSQTRERVHTHSRP